MLKIDKIILKAAFTNTIPVLTGYIVLGIGFGVLLVTHGFAWWLAPIMSLTMYAGAMQYLGVSLLASHVGVFGIAITTLLVNARHLFYGISLLEKYQKISLLGKVFLAFGLTDETYSLIASEPKGENKEQYYFYVTILDHFYWITGSTLGAVAGTVLPFNSTGIDFALTALFIAIFMEQWMNTDNHYSALTGLAAGILCLVFWGSKNFLIPTMIIIGVVLTVIRHYDDGGCA